MNASRQLLNEVPQPVHSLNKREKKKKKKRKTINPAPLTASAQWDLLVSELEVPRGIGVYVKAYIKVTSTSFEASVDNAVLPFDKWHQKWSA
jgi:hypothetical protein